MNHSNLQRFPAPPATVFFVGIGGIGMSGLAQMLLHLGYSVGGSDRGLNDPAKADLYEKLQKQGIQLFPQDGSGIGAFAPDCLIYSAAVEENNPDFLAAGELPRFHRADALSQCLLRQPGVQIAVAGSCGKTSVTGWLTSALRRLGHQVLMVNGGYCLDFETPQLPGNFYSDPAPEFSVVEVDESDRSIVSFHPDYSIVLNIGNDHYDTAELERVFSVFLQNTKQGAVLPAELSLPIPPRLKVEYFAEMPGTQQTAAFPENFQSSFQGSDFFVHGFATQVHCTQSGLHSAWNASAILQMLKLILPEKKALLPESLADFRGVRQRFELVSSLSAPCPVVNDYAHNPEKIAAALRTAQERFGGAVFAVFQPHGFSPLRFMREALLSALKKTLHPEDKFVFLPVYYAGGTASHTPTSQEVVDEYKAAGLPVFFAESRTQAEILAKEYVAKRCMLVMGARDASLRLWSMELGKD